MKLQRFETVDDGFVTTSFSEDFHILVISIIRENVMTTKEVRILKDKKLELKAINATLKQLETAITQFEATMKEYKLKLSSNTNGKGSTGSMARKLPGVDVVVKCPVCKDAMALTLFSIIIELNDDHKWTRERIADWIETLDIDIEFAGQA